MPALNKVMLMGYLGRDPELHYTPDGVPVTSFSLAVREVDEGDGGQGVEWFNVVAWRHLAELCTDLFHKDQCVYVEGHLHTRGWKDEGGQRLFRTEIVATDLIPLDDSALIAQARAKSSSTEVLGIS
jgi:single-strand DNA-binding protein